MECSWRYALDSSDSSDSNSSSSSDNSGEMCEPAVLPCMIANSRDARYGVKVNALPDSGCDLSTVTEDLASAIGARVLRTPETLYGATGESVEVSGKAVIYVRVKGVSVKRLVVLVETHANCEVTFGYRDLIQLRVLAPNFPNLFTDPTAPLLPHPYGNSLTTPLLACTVYFENVCGTVQQIELEVVPDTGCSGSTIVSCSFASRTRIMFSKTNIQMRAASDTKMIVYGEAYVSISVKETTIHTKVVITDTIDDMLLCWRDLISLGVLPESFPMPTPE